MKIGLGSKQCTSSKSLIKNLVHTTPDTQQLNKLLVENELEIEKNNSMPPTSRLIPVINKVAAGYPEDFSDLDYPVGVADDYIRCPDLHDPNAFAVRVVGDSMEPKFCEGDIVVFSPAAEDCVPPASVAIPPDITNKISDFVIFSR